MNEIFLPFPFSLPDIIDDIAGESSTMRPAQLMGYRLVMRPDGWLPQPVLLCSQEGGYTPVDGVIVPASVLTAVKQLARLLGWQLIEGKTVEQSDGDSALVAALLPVETELPDQLTSMERWSAPLFREVWRELREMPESQTRPLLSQVLARATARLGAQTPVPTDLRTDAGINQVAELDREVCHDGFFRYERVELRHPRFDGTMSGPVTREVFVATDAAIVLPYDPKTDRVLLVEQFRMGPYIRRDPVPFCLEPVAGRVDGGEHPETTARRECEEEAGLSIRRLLPVSNHYPSPGASTEYFYCYIGLCDLPELRTGSGGLDSEDEDIRTHVVPFERAMELVNSGEINIGPLVLMMLWLAQHRANLREHA